MVLQRNLKLPAQLRINWNASSALSDTTISNPIANPLTTTKFIVTGYSS